MTTRTENTIIFKVEGNPPVKTEIRVIEVSTIEATIKIDKTTGIKALFTDGIANLLTMVLSPFLNAIL